MPEVARSESETRRFGLEVGRVSVDADEAAEIDALVSTLATDPHDLVIVRYPSAWVTAFHRLAATPSRRAIYADTLLYFEWQDDGGALPAATSDVPVSVSVSDVPGLIAAIFAGYRNHYAANEHLDAALVAVGYAEWATSVATDGANVVVATGDGGAGVEGLAVIDTRGDVWDVVLAGVRPASRGRGAYGRLMAEVMARARAAGQRAVRISTQSHNLPVMRTWERLGWRIISATVTVHVERADD